LVTITRHTDKKGRLTLGPDYADRDVTVEYEAGRVIIERAVIIPEREAWLYQNPEALDRVRIGLAEAREERFVWPDLTDAFALADSIPDE
jgi:hypothetical protein